MGKVKQEKQTKHKRRRGSLSRRVQKVLAGIVFVLITASLVSILVVMRRERMEYTVREAEGLLNGTTNSIYSEVERYKELSRLVLMDEPLAIFLRAETDDVSIGMINEARYSVMRTFNVTENVDSVFVFREDTQYMTTTLASNRSAYVIDEELMATTEWRDPILNGKGNALVQINGDGALKRTNGHPMITITRAVYDLLRQKRTGIMMFNISNSMTERLVQENIRGENICIMGTDGTFLAGNKDLTQYYDPKFYSSEVVYEQMKMGDDMVLLAGKGVEEMPVVVLYSTVVGAQAFPLVTIYILAILLAVYLVSVIVAAIFITRNITSPVFRLTEAMEQNRQEGKIEKIEVPLPKNELGMLEDEYNNMIDHVNDLIKKLIEKEKILQNAEMRVLHEQIKPHFLYNSLETIGFLAMDAGAENVHNALETLGSFYRNFLSKGDREVSLRREVAIVQDYLSLQKLRYGDIIGDEYDIAEDTKDCIVPKLILQPLIENSIYHGIRLKGEAGTIRISSFMEGDVLHLIVRDTGVGMSQEKIDEILNKDNTESQKINEESSESFGLWGTIERIRCFCDSDDVVKIRSDEGEFTEIEFIFPHSKRKDRSTRREDHVQSDDHR
ncbi:MAG: sensor histidine kinase [Lachnospiraceae bacterium]|nr:sensor histidine kinase [Lachnospiraceae bacterium]